MEKTYLLGLKGEPSGEDIYYQIPKTKNPG